MGRCFRMARRVVLLPMAVMLGLLGPAPATAQEGEVVLLGWVGRQGSLSQAGSSPAVFLRWDVTEGALPETLDSVTLYRGQNAVATLPAHGHRTASEIDALYALPANQRRQLEMIRWLSDLDPDVTINEVTLGEAVVDKLDTDSFWAHFAARIDPVVAVARYRAFVDASAAGTVLYRLEGTFVSGATVELGRVSVDTAAASILPAAVALRQIPVDEMARCDAPEAFRVHGSVALDWDAPHASPAERLAFDMATAGWDLFRTRLNVESAPPRDLRAEAELLPHGLDGRVELPDLEQVNDQPLLIASDLPDVEPGGDGWAPAAAAWFETHAELLARGVEPGDQRAYYLVPRDITGNWGETASVYLTVPDLVPPPAPWEVRAVARPAIATGGGAKADRVALRWPEMSVLGFAQQHPGRTFCNLDVARLEGRLAWTDGALCPPDGEGAVIEANLDITSYRVYRFESVGEARRFTDADGDGHADLDERTVASDPGTACDPTLPGTPGAVISEVPATDARTLKSGRRILELEDTTPALTPGKVYWYLVAAVTVSGQQGPLSAPVRAVFPEYHHKSRLAFGVPTQGAQCTPFVKVLGDKALVVGQDHTGKADRVRLSCKGSEGVAQWEAVLQAGEPVAKTGPWPFAVCNPGGLQEGSPAGELGLACRHRQVLIEYLSDAPPEQGGGVIAKKVVFWGGNVPACEELHSALLETCPEAPLPGHVGVVGLDFPEYDPEQGCIGVYREIGGRMQRLELICDQLSLPDPYDAPTLAGDQVCLYTAVHDRNALVSPKLALGCVAVAEATAEPPQLLGMTFDAGATTATVRYRPPSQRLVGALVEWSREGGADRASTFVPQPAVLGPLGDVTASVDLGAPPPAPGESQRWSFRARMVVSKAEGVPLSDTLSEWSPSMSVDRLGPAPTASEYLPWPTIPTPPEGDPLSVLYLGTDGLPIVHLASFDPDPQLCATVIKSCDVGVGNDGGYVFPKCYLPQTPLGADCKLTCDDIEGIVQPALGFVAYRQSRKDDASPPSDYVQVSPLVNRMHCSGEDLGPLGHTTIADPFVAMLDFSGLPEPWVGKEIFFVDGDPHIVGLQYRYQFVYFDVKGEILRSRTSAFVTAH